MPAKTASTLMRADAQTDSAVMVAKVLAAISAESVWITSAPTSPADRSKPPGSRLIPSSTSKTPITSGWEQNL